MRRLIFLWVLYAWMIRACLAAGGVFPCGSRSQAMGGTTVAVSDLWCACNNPAGLALLHSRVLGLTLSNRFMMTGLMSQHFALAWPFRAIASGLSFSRYGNTSYNEISAGLSVARSFGKRFSAGVRISYLRIHAGSDQGNRNLATASIGLIFRPASHLTAGIRIENPVPVKVSPSCSELLPLSLYSGVSWLVNPSLLVAFEAGKELSGPLEIRAGTEYRFARTFVIRAGCSTGPAVFTFGVGLETGRLTVDISSGYHTTLGFSPSASLNWNLGGKP